MIHGTICVQDLAFHVCACRVACIWLWLGWRDVVRALGWAVYSRHQAGSYPIEWNVLPFVYRPGHVWRGGGGQA